MTTTDPAGFPLGTILRDPDLGRLAVRFQQDDTTGRGMHAWYVPAPDPRDARVLHHAEVRRWELVELPPGVAEVVRAVLGRESKLAAANGQKARFWADHFEEIEKANRDALGAHHKPGYSVAELITVLVGEVARLTRERDALSQLLRGMARRVVVCRQSYDDVASAYKAITAEVEPAMEPSSCGCGHPWHEIEAGLLSRQSASRPAIPAFLAGFVYSLRKAGWSDKEITGFCEDRLGSGLDLPADAENLAWSACMGDDKFTGLNSDQILEVIRRTLKAVAAAPVSGSDTTEDGGDRG